MCTVAVSGLRDIVKSTIFAHLLRNPLMVYHSFTQNNIRISTGRWQSAADARKSESFSIFSVTDAGMAFRDQMDALLGAVCSHAQTEGTPVFMRIMLSDPAVQLAELQRSLDMECPVSVIGQAPLDGTCIAAVVWFRSEAEVKRLWERMYRVSRSGVDEYWFVGGLSGAQGTYGQTVALLDELSCGLQAQGLTLENDCVRTWFFVRDIDSNYKGVVDGRNDVFDRHGLTSDTHFIASTGIEGFAADPSNMVTLDGVAVNGHGLKVKYLYADSHLNRTSEYGVRFERGTVVEYADRRHVFISGTASIDNKGNILYEGDICRQTERMIENVGVLLAEAGCGFADVGSMTLYLRNASHYDAVKRIFDKRFPDTPVVIVLAPVCRPGWLVEMECVGII